MHPIPSDRSTSDAQTEADIDVVGGTARDDGDDELADAAATKHSLDAAFFLALVEGLGQHAKSLRASRIEREHD